MAKFQQLTARQVATLTKPGFYADGQRLYLQVSPTGTKSWAMRYSFQGRIYSMGLGSVYVVSLQEARRRAQLASLQLLDGVNPLEQKRARRAVEQVAEKSKPFEWCAREYVIANQQSWKGNREAKRFCQVIADFANPHIGKMPVRDITKEHVVKVLNPIWQTKATTAKLVRRHIEHILGWAEDKGLRSGDNPATKDALRHLLGRQSRAATKVTNHPSLPWQEVGAFVRDLRADSSIQCRALELLILTASRTDEVLGARWSEFDLDKRVWVIPAGRMKAGKEHDVPLTSAMLQLLDAMPRIPGNPHVFPGRLSGGRLAPTSMQRWIRVSHGDDTITVHGFRTTFRTWAAECTDYPREIAEMALAHAVGNQVEAAYQRSKLIEKRRPLMEAWGEFVTKPPARVIALHA